MKSNRKGESLTAELVVCTLVPSPASPPRHLRAQSGSLSSQIGQPTVEEALASLST